MDTTALKTRSVKASLCCLLLTAIATLEAAPLLINEIDITPLKDGDALQVTYEGEISTLIFAIDKEKRATLTLTKAQTAPELVMKKGRGKLIRSLKIDNHDTAEIELDISFKRRLGRHTRKGMTRDGKKIIYLELLDEVLDKPPEQTEKSVIQPTVEKGIFAVDGTKEQRVLNYDKEDRKQVETNEFLSLFGHKVIPRPNRVTALNYKLDSETLQLKFALHQQPNFTLKTRSDPPRIELTMNKILGDFEINHNSTPHDYLGNITTTRDNKNTLTMQVSLSETAQASSMSIKNRHGPGYQFIVDIKRIYPWETEAAIPDFNAR